MLPWAGRVLTYRPALLDKDKGTLDPEAPGKGVLHFGAPSAQR